MTGGLGTLIGLVQMLQQLDDPAVIGPATAVASLNPKTAATALALRRGSSGSERWLEARAAGGLGRGFAARGFRTDAALASDADATGASAGGGNVDYYSVKPAKGKNRWRRARKKAAFIKEQARAHRENKTARAEEREAERLQRWREQAEAARAWRAMRDAEAVNRAEAALREMGDGDGDRGRGDAAPGETRA